MRPRVLVPAAAAVVLVAVGLFFLLTSHSSTLPRSEVGRYLSAWSKGDTAAMAALLDAAPSGLNSAATSLVASAPGTTQAFTLTTLTKTEARYHAHASVAGFGPLDWDGSLPLVRANGAWRIRWTPADLYPSLTGSQHLVLHRAWATRAPILADDGTPLVSDQTAVTVGLEPDHITDLTRVQTALASLLGVDPATVQKALTAPGVKPNFFVPIITIRTDRYQVLRPQLAPVPGILFQHTQTQLAASDNLAPHVLGTVGEITAEILAKRGPPYRAGDKVGLSGLEAVYETRLAGTPTGSVDVVDSGKTVTTVHQFPGAAPQPVQITLDRRIQEAAQAALASVTKPAALVAVDATTGDLRAIVSVPSDQPFDRALDGAYPPGSTFKVITAAALLAAGRTPATVAQCPTNLTVGGRTFTNFEGEAPGAIPLHRAFAISCNTAFIGLATQLPAGDVGTAAAKFGFGQPITLPLPAIGGSYPPPADQTEAAAAAIGQARVTASPLLMASVAVTAATGQWRPPQLVLQPAPGSGPGAATPSPLAAGVAAALRGLMGEVVTSGTGTAAAVTGQQIFGKTGTAEFGNATPPSTHAWFIGFHDQLAFAVLVEGGGVGGIAAAPIAAKFLAATL